jgi:lipopolysaccharide biosynthesis glycosyltransferase
MLSMDSDLVYCEEIRELMEELQLEYMFQGVEAFH